MSKPTEIGCERSTQARCMGPKLSLAFTYFLLMRLPWQFQVEQEKNKTYGETRKLHQVLRAPTLAKRSSYMCIRFALFRQPSTGGPL